MRTLNRLRLLFCILTFAISLGFWAGYAYEYTSVAIGKKIALLVIWWDMTPELLHTEINLSLEEDRLEDARFLIRMNQEYGYPHRVTWDEELERKSTFLYAAKKAPKDVYRGVAYGEMASKVSTSAAITSDLVGIGDFRDLAVQGYKVSKGEELDKLIAGLAAFGVVTTFATPILDAGVSLAKAAARQTAKQSSGFRNLLSEQLAGAINYNELSHSLAASENAPNGLIVLSERVNRSLRFDKISDFFKELGIIANNSGGMRNSLTLVSRATDMDGLKAVSHATKAFGDQAAIMVRLGGEKVVRAFGKRFQRLVWLIAAVLTLVLVLIQIAFLVFWRNF